MHSGEKPLSTLVEWQNTTSTTNHYKVELVEQQWQKTEQLRVCNCVSAGLQGEKRAIGGCKCKCNCGAASRPGCKRKREQLGGLQVDQVASEIAIVGLQVDQGAKEGERK